MPTNSEPANLAQVSVPLQEEMGVYSNSDTDSLSFNDSVDTAFCRLQLRIGSLVHQELNEDFSEWSTTHWILCTSVTQLKLSEARRRRISRAEKELETANSENITLEHNTLP